MSATRPLLEVEDLVVEFAAGRGRRIHAVSGLSFHLNEGETLGLVGESGCGKSSAARAILQLPPPNSGRVIYRGKDLTALDGEALRALRPRLQMIFQDPISSLNPRRRIGETVAAPLRIAGVADREARRAKVREVLEAVGLDPETTMERLPYQFSGGQCQRVSVARALIVEPDLLICDEPVSALDVSVQAQILNLLRDMKARYGLTMLFISHDLAVVRNVSDRVAVMYLGRLCEIAPSERLYRRPAHPYTAALLSAIPEPDPARRKRRVELTAGELPSPADPPSGCRFRTRCPRAEALCAEVQPPLSEIAKDHAVACHFPLTG